MKKTKALSMLYVMALIAFFANTKTTNAASLEGINADEIKVKVYAKQGNDWFQARYMETDSDGVLEIKNVLPGKYKVTVREEDQESTQVIAAKFRMLDNNGTEIDAETDVKIYAYINDVKTYLGTWETDEDGWIDLSALYPELEYSLEINKNDNVSLESKKDAYRIKVSAQIDESDWFRGYYARTDANKVLEAKDVLPGKYKFKFNKKDATSADTFTLKLRMLNDDAEKIDEKTAIEVYAYIGGAKVLVGATKTDNEGWIVLPGVMTGMKYQIKVK